MKLQLPKNYLEIEQEEMFYLDGGAYGTNGVSFHWWGMQVSINGGVMKKLFNYSIDGLFSTGIASIAVYLGVTNAVAGTIAIAVAAYNVVLKAIHNGYHGVSFNIIGNSALFTVVPWRQ